METHGIIIIDPSQSPSRITVMPKTHDLGPEQQHNIECALKRYTDRVGHSNFEWMAYKEPLTIHNL